MKCTSIFLIAFFLVGLHNLSAQVKYEKEYKINAKEVPTNALQFVHSFSFKKKVKWYKEEKLTGFSFEAKSTLHRKKYSIEFDDQGKLEDVEIKIRWSEIELSARQKITSYLDSIFDKYKFVKIQKQFSGNEKEVLGFLLKKEDEAIIIEKFEIVLYGSKDKQHHEYEFTFSDKGDFESKVVIVQKNTDNLEY